MRRREGWAEAELALGDAECVACHARLETRAALAALHDSLEVFAHRLDQLGGRRATEGCRRCVCGKRAGRGGRRRGQRRHVQHGEEIPLALAHAPADGGQLDRSRHAAEVGGRLQRADGRPFDGGVHLPPPHPGHGEGLTTRVGIGLHELGDRAEATQIATPPEAPRGRAQPPDVLRRVADVRQLPVEHATQPVAPDQEVAHPVVTVHDRAGAARRPVGGQPAHAELEGRAHLAQRVEERQRVAQRVRRGEPGDGSRIDGVDGGQRTRHLAGEGAARLAPLVVAQDLARNRLPLQAVDHQPTRPHLVALAQGDHARHRHAGGSGGAQQVRLKTRPATRGAAAAVHLQDERAQRTVGIAQVERAGHTRGTTRQALHPLHGAAEPAPERRCQLFRAQPRRHPYSTGTTGLPLSSSWCRYSQMP